MKSAHAIPIAPSYCRTASGKPNGYNGNNKRAIEAARDECSREVVFFGKLLHQRHYISGCDGNLSLRFGRDCVLVTPTGFGKGFLRPRDIIAVDLEGNKIEGLHAPTSESRMHLMIYRCCPDAGAVVHAHPYIATGFASAGMELTETLCSELHFLGGVPLAPYAPPGTEELSKTLEPLIANHHAILMERHGVVTWAETLERAYLYMETVEHCARIVLTAHLLGQSIAGTFVSQILPD